MIGFLAALAAVLLALGAGLFLGRRGRKPAPPAGKSPEEVERETRDSVLAASPGAVAGSLDAETRSSIDGAVEAGTESALERLRRFSASHDLGGGAPRGDSDGAPGGG